MDFQHPGAYLTFEVVSFVPYDRNLIDVSLLSPEQVSVFNTACSSARSIPTTLGFSLASNLPTPRTSALHPEDPHGGTLGTCWWHIFPAFSEITKLLGPSRQTSMPQLCKPLGTLRLGF